MKKRMLVIVLSVAMCMGLIPVTAFAGTEGYVFAEDPITAHEDNTNDNVGETGMIVRAEEGQTAHTGFQFYINLVEGNESELCTLWECEVPENSGVTVMGRENYFVVEVADTAVTATYDVVCKVVKKDAPDGAVYATKIFKLNVSGVDRIEPAEAEYDCGNGNMIRVEIITNDKSGDYGDREDLIGALGMGINSSVTEGNGVFTMPHKVGDIPFKAIGYYAFQTAVTEIIIPHTLIYIHPSAVMYADTGKFTVSADNPNYKDVDGVLFSKDGKTIIRCLGKTEYVIPSGTEAVEVHCFANMHNLTKVYIPKTVKEFKGPAFIGTKDLVINYEGTEAEFNKISGGEMMLDMIKGNSGTVNFSAAAPDAKPDVKPDTKPDVKPDAKPQPEPQKPVVIEEVTKEDVDKTTDNVVVNAEKAPVVEITAAAVKQVEAVGAKGLTVKFDGNKVVSYDQKAVDKIIKELGTTGTKVEVKLVEADKNTSGNEKQKAAMKDKALGLFSIELSITDNTGKETLIHKFDGGKATVTVPFVNDGKKELQVFRVEDDGTLTPMETTFKDGKLTWVTDGHSYYMVAEKATVTPVESEKEKAPETGDSADFMMWVMILGAALAGTEVYRRKFNK